MGSFIFCFFFYCDLMGILLVAAVGEVDGQIKTPLVVGKYLPATAEPLASTLLLQGSRLVTCST